MVSEPSLKDEERLARRSTESGGLVAKSYPTLAAPWTVPCLPGSSVHGALQVKTLEWAAISFSRGSSQPRD